MDFFTSSSGSAPKAFKGYTLVCPCICVGNVAQLTSDLLISTLHLEPVGRISHPGLVPIIGSDPFQDGRSATDRLMTAVEVYHSPKLKLAVIQQRSPFLKGFSRQYVRDLVAWIQQAGFSSLVVLSASFAHERIDIQLSGSQFRFLASTPDLEKSIKSQGWVELEKRHPTGLEDVVTGEDLDEYYIPGSGIAKQLLNECSDASVPCAVLLMFCAEGDNTQDAIAMATQLNQWKQWAKDKQPSAGDTVTWQPPSSWKLLFGSDYDQGLFL